ncbi:translational GTPase TypA [Amycolatopsis cihanbeyliensis]|uniref:Large ribosomal subunit assembly factor BipA n=1 Tax=Amycolatopsis cihanbeyliensis TaxID=1128664 RepID=A0A542DHL2_AMYCI|nr:translational GTPase TypA [Amycolatopsis cihanbeyliensis]TQJ02577.1 GTP-binding protein [Amycolatopsis cihanbeyliensis]
MTVDARPASRLPGGSGSSASRPDLRNIAIVAHVDHGKTTLVDAMLRQSGAFAERAEPVDRVMDSGELEREKGITILAKNTAIRRVTEQGPVIINVIDTPGHADFGGEVERGLAMVDGVVLLVDASEGPLPQTRFVLRKTLEAGLPVLLVVNKVDRGDARIAEVVEETHDLLLDLASDIEDADLDAVLDLPVVYASARSGKASLERPADGAEPESANLDPLFETLLRHVPPPAVDPEAPLRALVTNLDASSFLGRIALIRIHAGRLRKGQTVAWMREDGSTRQVRVSELLVTEALTRVPAQEAAAGDLVAIAGIPDITIGDTLADPERPEALPRITVDEPAISMTFGVNSSPLAGKGGGDKLTARLVKARLDQELIGNVSVRVLPTERPDTWEMQGRGELALAVLVEQMRREGFELTVGKPQVVTRTIDGKLHEPFERLAVDAPEEYLGAITQLLAARKGRMEQMSGHGTGRIKLDYVLPARGLIGFRTEFLTETRGTGIAHHVFEGYFPWAGEIRTRNNGSLVADRSGPVTAYALIQLAERGTFFVEPGAEVYEGMVVGENPRAEDLDINITKEKKLTNVRSSTGEELERLARPRKLGLEEALEFCAMDECVEVAPHAVRVRKVTLDIHQRAKERSRAKQRDQA